MHVSLVPICMYDFGVIRCARLHARPVGSPPGSPGRCRDGLRHRIDLVDRHQVWMKPITMHMATRRSRTHFPPSTGVVTNPIAIPKPRLKLKVVVINVVMISIDGKGLTLG